MTGAPPIRVLIADDQALIRVGFRLVLEAEDDLVVVGEAADGQEAADAAARLRPDVVLMDVRMPVLDGIAATALLARIAPRLAAYPVRSKWKTHPTGAAA